jgi:hypothetical protein
LQLLPSHQALIPGLVYPGVFDDVKASNRGSLIVLLLFTTFMNLPFNFIMKLNRKIHSVRFFLSFGFWDNASLS